MNNLEPVFLFGDHIAAYGVIKALSPYKIPIYLFSSSGKGLCCKSKFAKKTFILDPFTQDFYGELIKKLSSVSSEGLIMIAGDDFYLDSLSKISKQIEPNYISTFPDHYIVEKVRNKNLTYQISGKIGVPYPKTALIQNDEELKNFIEKNFSIKFPLLLKSEKSKELLQKYKVKGVICENKEEIIYYYKKYDNFFGKLLIQEYIPGKDDKLINFIGVYDRNSRPISYFINRKVRTSNQFLSCTLMENSWNDDIVMYSNALVKEIQYYGYINTEFKYDDKDNKFKLMEINGRISLSNSHCLVWNQNVILDMYEEYSNCIINSHKIINNRDLKDRFLWWSIIDDLISAIRLILRKKLKFKEFIHSLKAKKYIVEPFYIKDLHPFFYFLIKKFKIKRKEII
jgi:predicted ATP-grasp superfamily ATP-dependent carboligase